MDYAARAPAAPAAVRGASNHLAWYLTLLPLLAWQGWMTLSLFAPPPEWQPLIDDRPIVSGRHALHLYHGWLGARSMLKSGSLCCYDPAFQAGYPKTPLFDSGCRPAELFLLLVGGSYQPAAYKIGLAICCLLAPLVVLLATRTAGLARAPACLAVALTQLVWWSVPGRTHLEAGRLDLLLASLAALAQCGLLLRFDRQPGFWSWIGVLAAGYFGWFVNPLFFALFLPISLVYYYSVGHRHGLGWHTALLGGLAGAVACNAVWLSDWVNYWWVRAPVRVEARFLNHRTLATFWEASFWGEAPDRALTVLLLAAACFGYWRLSHARLRSAARLIGFTTLTFLVLAVVGIAVEPLGSMGAARLLVPGLMFAAVAASQPLVDGLAWLCLRGFLSLRTSPVALLGLIGAGFALYTYGGRYAERCQVMPPLHLGLTSEREALVEALRTHTTPAARILWEERTASRWEDSEFSREDTASEGWHWQPIQRWTTLLPLLTERSYLGGLDPDACIEHTYPSLSNQMLAGRSLADWSDAELSEFCDRYNVGWVVCWSPPARKRFRTWKAAEIVTNLSDDGPGMLFRIKRKLSFALKGKAEWLRGDSRRICLGDVVPEDGQVVLSLHYQEGMKASPSRVRVERELDPLDPIPLVRLRLTAPVSHVTLTWEGR